MCGGYGRYGGHGGYGHGPFAVRRGFLAALLAFGAFAGFASGIRHVAGWHHHGAWQQGYHCDHGGGSDPTPP